MQEADGTAILTEHKSIEALSIFIRHLAALLHHTGIIPYEIACVQPPKVTGQESSNSDFSGFEEVSEGECSCRLFLAEEIKSNTDIPSDVSSVSSVSSVTSDTEEELDSSEADTLIDKVNDSAVFLNEINTSVFDEDNNNDNIDKLLVNKHIENSNSIKGVTISCKNSQNSLNDPI